MYAPYVPEYGKSVLHGVTSWGYVCGVAGYPGSIFSNVFSMKNFIDDILVRKHTI